MTDNYNQMRQEIVSLWKILRNHSPSRREIKHKISNISDLAVCIGGKVQDDAERLKREVYQFLQGALDQQAIERMFLDALKLEQETREL